MTKISIFGDQKLWAGSPSLGLAAGKWASVMNDFCQHLYSQHAHVAARPGCGVGKGRSPFPTPHPLRPTPHPSPTHPHPIGLQMSNPTRPPTGAKNRFAGRIGSVGHPAGPPPHRALSPGTRRSRHQCHASLILAGPHESLLRVHGMHAWRAHGVTYGDTCSAPRSAAIPQHVVARQRDGRLAVGGRGA
jgi:hypothetical protein